MKFISRRIHAILDYVVGILLVLAPTMLGFADNPAAKYSAVIVGILVLGMSLMTRYEGGVVKIVPMSVHLFMDIIIGFFLAVSPWLLQFSSEVFIPHLFFGLFAIGAGIFTISSSKQGIGRRGVLN